MKIYAKQVPPEYQESPLFLDGLPDGLEIAGNPDYCDHTSTLFENIPEALDALCWEWEEMHAGRKWERAYSTWAEALNACAPPEGRTEYTRDERRTEWPAVVLAYHNAEYITPEIYAAALSLITGKTWNTCTLRGATQGEWQTCYYRADLWNGGELERLEAEYFNTGSEWIVHDGDTPPEGPEGIDGFSVYCVEWNADGIRQEIADAAGGDAADVILYHFSGYERRATYSRMEAE